MYSVGTRELKQHTGEILERVRNGERVLLTLRGEPVAVISPIDSEAVEVEADRAKRESLDWLAASEGSFSFWDNAEDEVRDEVTESSFSTDEVDEAVLALLHLNAFEYYGEVRSWKTYNWDAMDRLHERGLIGDPKSKAKSVPLTAEGVVAARESFRRRFAKP